MSWIHAMRPLLYNALGLAIAAITLAGCQTITPDWAQRWIGSDSSKIQESKYAAPVKMATIWTPAVFNQPGQPPTRGLGGRIYFYDGNNSPIAVQGQLVVYAYDDSKPGSTHREPDRKYAFTSEQFTQHYSPTELGAAYSVWIPWDEVGKPEAEINLVPVFTAASGQLVMGQSSKNLLPGPKTHVTPPQDKGLSLASLQRLNQAAAQMPASVQPAAHQEPSPAGQPNKNSTGLDALSIQLPSGMAERLSKAPPPESLSLQWAQSRALAQTPIATATPQPVAATPQPNPQGAPPTRSEPGRLPAPALRGLPPTAGQTLRPPFHAG
jgi:hypothetical protein